MSNMNPSMIRKMEEDSTIRRQDEGQNGSPFELGEGVEAIVYELEGSQRHQELLKMKQKAERLKKKAS